ncbi:MAG: ABC transporter permease [Gammaproteobacteria bacterium]|nr:ABC transporter permease [Gammaproteobacteria bacterium]
MGFRMDILATDVLLYILFLSIAGFAFYASRHEHLRTPWRQVRRRPMAMAALVLLLAYVTVGALDSVHFQLVDKQLSAEKSEAVYHPDSLSLLDLVIEPLRVQKEKTYSSPFAVYGFTKETVEQEPGKRARSFSRLTWGGRHLEDPATVSDDIASRTLKVLVLAFMTVVAVAALVSWRIQMTSELSFQNALRLLARGEADTPWRAILSSLFVLLFVVFFIAELGPLYHIFGTDQVGNDVLYKSLKSIRTGLMIGTLTTLIMLPFAVMLGITAGYFRGWADDVIQYLYTTLSSIPGVLLIAAAILSLDVYMANNPEGFNTLASRADTRLLFLCMILGIMSWTGLCRLVRAETMKLREADYVQAAQALGVRAGRIMTRHIFPNLMHIVLITIVLDFSGLVLAEAVLSYVGVGVDPSMDSWGNMINGARLEMAREPMVWWSLTAAFIFMFGLVLAANIFSDAVRDAFDPRLRKR